MRNKSLIIALLALSQLSCTDEKQVELTTLAQTTHCPIEQVGLSVYKTPAAFARALEPPSGQLKQRLEPQQEGVSAEQSIQLPNGSWAVVVNLGQRPSAGYGIKLESTKGRIAKGTLTIQLEQHQPAPETMQATMITTPCVIVTFDEQDIQQIEARTESQQWQHETRRD